MVKVRAGKKMCSGLFPPGAKACMVCRRDRSAHQTNQQGRVFMSVWKDDESRAKRVGPVDKVYHYPTTSGSNKATR